MLTLYAGYLELTGTIVEDAANGIAALRQVQHIGDAWLRDQGGSGPAVFKAHWGTVAFSFVAAPDRKRLDAYGVTVDTTAVLNSPEARASMTPQVFPKLSAVSRKTFTNPKPPVTNTPAAAQRRPAPQYDRPT